MIRKKMTSITVILAVLFVLLGIFLYRIYIVPFYQNNLSKTTTITLDKDQQLILTKYPEQEHVFSIEIEVTGTSKENLEVIISNPSKTSAHNARIKQGNIDYVYVNDWYEDTCLLDIRVGKSGRETLEIEYRFIGTQ